MSLRGVERRSNLSSGQLEIAWGFALAMTIFQSFRVTETGITSENPYSTQFLADNDCRLTHADHSAGFKLSEHILCNMLPHSRQFQAPGLQAS